MADDADWFADAGDEPEAPEAPAQAAEAAPAGDASADAPAGDAPPAEGDETKREVADDEQYLDPDKLLVFKHWIRPKFLQYRYLYDYRHNYYDDVIDYLDKRQRGLSRDMPRPQTWAERALRTYTKESNRMETNRRMAEDTKLVSNMHMSGSFYRHHTREYINRRYSSLLF